MLTDKEMKKAFKEEIRKNPEKHYPVDVLKDMGFVRNTCKYCGTDFWSTDPDRDVCGDSSCLGGLSFIGDTPAKEEMNYLDVYPRFRKFFEKKGYLHVPRKPVVARWRDDAFWVAASVYGFQPYVVRGEIKPPANAVVIPQLSLRFNDVDNVGITGSHYVCFDMLGQLHFERKEDYKPDVYFSEYFEWINKGMGIPENEIILHEDSWAGGGTFGPSIEFFSRGMEIGNQVYMQYANTPSGKKELDIKVLDMGQGHERVPWFTQGKSTSYETTFPTVNDYISKLTGFKTNHYVYDKFLPYSTLLNVDEVDDVNKVWEEISNKIGVDVGELKDEVLTTAARYSIAEHSRAALVALHDGALPSNVGGGYNIRVVIRRAFSLIEKYGWNIDFNSLIEKHALFLKPLYPELIEYLDDIYNILDSEKRKFHEGRRRAMNVIKNALRKNIGEKELIELYDSHGIDPEQIRDEGKKIGKEIKIPDNFYKLVSEMHKEENVLKTKKEIDFDVEGITTERLYYDDYKLVEFDAEVVRVKDNMVALDRTAFYPTSGGQIHDIGKLNGFNVVDVVKKGDAIIHILDSNAGFNIGDKVHGSIDKERRIQVAQHHTGAHILNAAARKVLGPHVYQAGAAKTPEKARLDITHYDLLTNDEIMKIEEEANNIIKESIPIKKEIIPREVAEEKYGMRIYQGGFVPGKKLRIVSIGNIDVEACGGTHLDNTSEAELFKIIGTSKVQDGVIRINFVCGRRAKEFLENEKNVLEELAKLLDVNDYFLIPGRAEEAFQKWKKRRKLMKKGKDIDEELLRLSSSERYDKNDIIEETARRINSQPAHVVKSLKKFLN